MASRLNANHIGVYARKTHGRDISRLGYEYVRRYGRRLIYFHGACVRCLLTIPACIDDYMASKPPETE